MIKQIFWGSILLNSAVFGLVTCANVNKNVSSQNASSSRNTALVNITKHVLSDTCLITNQDIFFKIGDSVVTEGSSTGKLATSCIYAKKSKQFLEVAYLDQELEVIRIFSRKEVQAAKSILREKDKW